MALRFGAYYLPYVIEKGEWWRLFTSMFLHFGISHIVNNMISLYVLGNIVEAYYGKIRFLILYLVAGVGGNLMTLFVDLHSSGVEYGLEAGASGAIFGVMAAFVFFAVNPLTRKAFPFKRVIAGIFFALLPGFTSSGISLTAHIGGFITGLVLSFILNPYKQRKRLN